MAEGYMPQTKVDWTSTNAYTQFQLWRKEVERIVDGPLAGKSNAVKLNHIYIWAGALAERLIDAKTAENPGLALDTPKTLLDTLADCLKHATYFREAREKFYGLKQQTGENTTTYYSRIIDLYKQAEFPADTDFLIVDKLIHGAINAECKRRLMGKGKDVTVTDCLTMMRQHEAVDITMKHLTDTVQSCSVSATYSRRPRKSVFKPHGPATSQSPRTKTPQEKRSCVWCNGKPHPRRECPAKDQVCTFCKKQGHIEEACLKKRQAHTNKKHTKRQNVVLADPDPDSDSSGYQPDSFDVGTVTVSAVKQDAQPREVFAIVQFHSETVRSGHPGEKSHNLECKVDTGAMVSCLPLDILPTLGLSESNLVPSKVILQDFDKMDHENHGTVTMNVTCNGHKARFKFYVTQSGAELLLGMDFNNVFKLVNYSEACILRNAKGTRINTVHITPESEADYDSLRHKWKAHLPLGKQTGDPLEDLKIIFPTTFDGNVGLFQGEVDLKLQDDAQPIQLPPRAVPQSILPKLKSELDQLEKQGIIRPCPETTEWVHNIVTVVKKDGSLRICLDPRNLNKYLIRNVHHTASWEDAQHSFQNGKVFSTLDAKSAYWTKQLSAESQLLTAFNTPFKKYCFVRLPFGLSVSSEIFCETMDSALQGIPGTFPCADDVKVQGSTDERHDLHLLETVSRAEQKGLKFNPDKCFIKKRKIEYFGRVITPEGIEPCPKKVKAILKLEPPVDKQELQSFLGTVNFMSTFIPNLSQKTHLMRSLMKQDVHFVWTNDMEAEFNSVKQAIADVTSLTHYDPKKPAIIETDASLKGLGAVLIQDGRPVKFISKSLTPAESEYANIERELLAVLFACEKLHVYTFGRKTTIHTDHKPLVSIFQKPISLAPARLQRMLLRLRLYDIDVVYVGAKKVLLADTLSRLVKPGCNVAIPNLDVKIAQIMTIRPSHFETLQEETKTELAELRDLITNGWPESVQDIPPDIVPYWPLRDELTILDGLIMKGNRVVVPPTMRTDTLNRLHDAHQGLSSTLQRARRTVYWPKLQDDVSAMIASCSDCQIHGKKKPRPPERQVSATRPMQVLGMDLMEFRGRHALVSVDYYSGYITYDPIAAQTTEDVVQALNSNFQKFGLAERIISDNGPCFKSEKFSMFCKELEIKHTTSSPHFHQSNGRAERAIYTVKQILKKSKRNTDITVALVAYHDTPIGDTLPSPAELFFSRRINTRLGFMCQPTMLDDATKSQLMERRASHLRHSERKPDPFVPNDPIWFTEDGTAEWKPGFIDCRDPLPDSYWIINDESNRRLRRNLHDLKPRTVIHKERSSRVPTLPLSSPVVHSTPPICVPATQPIATPADDQQIAPPRPVKLPKPPPVTGLVPSLASPTAEPVKDEASARTSQSKHGRRLKPKKDPDFVY